MRYFITGAGGFIGRHLCRELLAQGKTVTALVRRGPVEETEFPGASIVQASLEDPEIYGAALADIDYVVHLAGDARFGDGPGYHAANVETTKTLLAALVAHAPKLRRLIFVSTMGAVDRSPSDSCHGPIDEDSPPCPTSDYGRSKWEAERLVAESGLPYAIVRPAMIVGPDMRANSHISVFSRMAVNGNWFSRFDWPGIVSVLHVDDLVSGFVLAAEHDRAAGGTFFAGGDRIAIGDLLEWAAPGRTRIPLRWFAALARPFMRLLPFQVKILLYPALSVDDSPLRELGWQPRFDKRSSVSEVIERERRRFDPAIAPAGRTVITGAASGLGRALAEALSGRGRRLLLIDQDAEGLKDVCPDHSDVERVPCDLSDEGALRGVLASTSWTREPIDEIFACAGFGLRGLVSSLPYERQADIFRVNCISRLQLVHHALRSMRRRQFGRIVLISSSSAYQALPFMSVYAASNAAVLLLGEGLSSEMREEGIEVLTVCPGGMHTRFQKTAGVQELSDEKLMLPEEVARQILAALGRNKTVIMPSFRSKAMAFAVRILPRRSSLALWHFLMGRLR